MNLEETRKFMQDLKVKLARGEITRAQFDKARAPIRATVLAENGYVETAAEKKARAKHFNSNT